VFSVVALLLVAQAPQPRLKLVYDPAETGCATKVRLVSAIVARLGADPFLDDAPETVEVKVNRTATELNASVVRSGPGGETGRRELQSPTLDCSELFRAVELAVAIAVDPHAGLVNPRPRVVIAPAPAVVTPVPEPETPLPLHAGLGLLGAIGNGPTPTMGFALMLGLQKGSFELGIGGRVELPSGLAVQGGRLGTQVLVGNLAACLAISRFRACGLGELGALRVSSTGIDPVVYQTVLVVNAGARFAVHFAAAEHFSLRPFIEVGASLARTTLMFDGAPVWVTPPVTGTLGLAFLLGSGEASK
jgi:hypothetical protein